MYVLHLDLKSVHVRLVSQGTSNLSVEKLILFLFLVPSHSHILCLIKNYEFVCNFLWSSLLFDNKKNKF